MASPMCSPRATTLLLTGGVLTFLVTECGLTAFASIVLLTLTLLLRPRAARSRAAGLSPLAPVGWRTLTAGHTGQRQQHAQRD